jgi:hypothetical protein
MSHEASSILDFIRPGDVLWSSWTAWAGTGGTSSTSCTRELTLGRLARHSLALLARRQKCHSNGQLEIASVARGGIVRLLGLRGPGRRLGLSHETGVEFTGTESLKPRRGPGGRFENCPFPTRYRRRCSGAAPLPSVGDQLPTGSVYRNLPTVGGSNNWWIAGGKGLTLAAHECRGAVNSHHPTKCPTGSLTTCRGGQIAANAEESESASHQVYLAPNAPRTPFRFSFSAAPTANS